MCGKKKKKKMQNARENAFYMIEEEEGILEPEVSRTPGENCPQIQLIRAHIDSQRFKQQSEPAWVCVSFSAYML